MLSTDRRFRRSALPLALLVALLSPACSAQPGGDEPERPTAVRAASTTSPQVTARATTPAYVPPIRHVFVINIENKGFVRTWGPDSKAPYLARTLRSQGVLLDSYYGTAHRSQGNYVAQISGQGPNPAMQSDCQPYSTFHQTGTQAPGQATGTGCVFPAGVESLPIQLSRQGLGWKGYMDDMERPCQHPALDARDPDQRATPTQNYATRHNPFVYFRAITGRPAYCRQHVVGLGDLRADLSTVRSTPNLAYITPDLCHDGHDTPCADGRPGGLVTVNGWMKVWVPRILASPAFRRDGLLVITADESDSPQSDSTACCGEGASANSPMPGIAGPGGGRIGALVLSRYTAGGTTSTTAYNHYSLLASIEEVFGLGKLGYAAADGLESFGLDVYNSGWNESSAQR